MLRLAGIQFRTLLCRSSTLSKATTLIDAAASKGAQMVVLPEAFTGLYGVEHFESNAESLLGQNSGTELMSRAAMKHGITVVGGVIESCSGLLYNTIFAFGPDGEVAARSPVRFTFPNRA